jgi:hypothetical protein
MLSVKGTFENGVASPDEPVKGHNGESVEIVFVESGNSGQTEELIWNDEDWDEFERIIDECAVDTGIGDLAYQHDHYIHGTPKRDPHL